MARACPLRVSVVIPTLNEAAYLPHLLEALAAQTLPADEIIVADAHSTDGTPELARRYGARVVPGGTPAVGRNAGARAASGDLLLFLDADVVPLPDFIERAVTEFLRRRCDVATVRVVPWDGNLMERVVHEAANLYFILMQPVLPYAPGFCILVRKSLHEQIGGFDETLRMSEDMDYVRRAARSGRFAVLTSTCIPVSMRRIRKEGMLRLGVKYLWCEAQMLRGKPIHRIPFEYEFGAFPPPSRPARPTGRHLHLPSISLREEQKRLQRALADMLPPRLPRALREPWAALEWSPLRRARLLPLPVIRKMARRNAREAPQSTPMGPGSHPASGENQAGNGVYHRHRNHL